MCIRGIRDIKVTKSSSGSKVLWDVGAIVFGTLNPFVQLPHLSILPSFATPLRPPSRVPSLIPEVNREEKSVKLSKREQNKGKEERFLGIKF